MELLYSYRRQPIYSSEHSTPPGSSCPCSSASVSRAALISIMTRTVVKEVGVQSVLTPPRNFSQRARIGAGIAIGTLTVAAQAANQRRKSQGELRASASRPLVQRLHDSPDILMRDPCPPPRKEAH